jgi:hypothetical protein
LIQKYSLATSGTVAATATLTPPAGFTVRSVITDTSGQIYVGGVTSTAQEILVYAAGSTGSATPTRTILGVASNPLNIYCIYVDAAGLLYVPTLAGVNVYGASASGPATPLRSISGTLTQVTLQVQGIAVDASGNIYLSSYAAAGVPGSLSSIYVFSSTASGNVAPTRVITAPSGQYFYGVAVDAAGDIYTPQNSTSAYYGLIDVFAPGATGAATPTRTFLNATGLQYACARFDAVGNFYTEAQQVTGAGNTYVVGFAPTASGLNTAPLISITAPTMNTYDSYEIGLI